MQNTRIIVERMCCECEQECHGDGPTPYPLSGVYINELGEHCTNQTRMADEKGLCKFLQWETFKVLKIEMIECDEEGEYVKLRKNW